MKQFRWKIAVCLIPVLISLFAVGRAFYLYQQGRGGFRLGVDLVGGTILVYEVDQDRNQNLQRGRDAKPEDLAEALKKRLDPRDQYNITVRPVGNDRVEIILPTGGQHQAQQQEEAWKAILQEASDKWPPAEGKEYGDIPLNDTATLSQRIKESPSKPDPAEIGAFINKFHDEKRQVTSEEVQEFKELIAQVGSLEFRILANQTDDAEAIQAAKDQIANLAKPTETKDAKGKIIRGPSELERLASAGKPPPPPNDGKPFTTPLGTYTYSWVELGRSERKSMDLDNAAEKDDSVVGPEGRQYVRSELWKRVKAARAKDEKEINGEPMVLGRLAGDILYSRKIPEDRELPKKDKDKQYEYFVLTRDPASEDKKVSGDLLTDASRGEKDLKPIVQFRFNPRGADLFGELTSINKPTGPRESAFRRHLAIILDGQIVSAPTINSIIRGDGIIEGNFTVVEVDRLVRILRAGALPATLKPIPVSENTMGATLGADTVKWGSISVLVAFGAILVFMLVYYRFAGIVACIALLANLLLTVAFMVMFGAAFTLPGLAGLVLMLGMAVDANVLIYERLREERDRGASLPLAIRNGYDRAFPTIIDTHLTSIFTAIVLFVVGNDQLKGFGISLTVGLIISLFTSLFMTRLMFDIWLHKGWLKQLRMMRFLTKPNIDFMAIRYYWFAFTIILTIFGLTVFLVRGRSGLNIDFIGGTAYSGQLANDHAMDISELRAKLGDDQQKERLAIEDVKQEGDDGRTFRILYQNKVRIGDSESKEETVSLSNATTEDDVRRRAAQLPDLSVEQIFLSSDEAPQPKSHFFTVRTSEKAPELVLASMNRLLGDELKRFKLDTFTIDQAGKKITLKFLDPEKYDEGKKEYDPAYASPAQVTMLLQRELRKLDLGTLAQHLKLDKAAPGEEKDGRRSRISFTYAYDGALSPAALNAKLQTALANTQLAFASRPQPERLENFDSQLAAETQGRALAAIGASWAAILLYLWFRFGSWTFGLAAVLCLVHDLCFTLGMIAFCHYIHHSMPGFATLLGLHDFKIDLPSVAALLTLVGYSVSDTIVVFDRIREVRGKNPLLTPQMINDSVNQTLSRTLLTAFSVWLVVFVLYVLGGEGVHLFAFVMVVGVIVGTYSSIYIASPLLLIFGEGAHPSKARQPQPTGASV
jgi:SecD/SecF fusion protein